MTWLIPTDQLPAPGRALARKLWDPRQPLAEPPTPEHLAAHPIGQTIRAATDYMDLIDQDWLRIADWYRPGTTPQHRLDHRELWQEGEGSLMIAQLQRTNIKTPSQYTFKECPSSFISSCVTLTQITQRRAGNYARATLVLRHVPADFSPPQKRVAIPGLQQLTRSIMKIVTSFY